MSLTASYFRTIRYKILVSHKIKLKDMFLITLVRNFAVDLLPARTASLLFYSYLTNKKGIKLEEGGSSFFVSMFYDVLALSIMLSIAFAIISYKFNYIITYSVLFLLFVLSLFIILFAKRIIQIIKKIKILNKNKKIKKITYNLENYFSEHESYKERGILFLLSFIIRTIKYVSLFILFIDIVDISFSLKGLSLFSFGIAGTELSSLLPIQGLGGFGSWELAFSIVFKTLNITVEKPFLIGLVLHTATQLWEYSIGVLSFLYLSIKKT